jgi:hypothetical protein
VIGCTSASLIREECVKERLRPARALAQTWPQPGRPRAWAYHNRGIAYTRGPRPRDSWLQQGDRDRPAARQRVLQSRPAFRAGTTTTRAIVDFDRATEIDPGLVAAHYDTIPPTASAAPPSRARATTTARLPTQQGTRDQPLHRKPQQPRPHVWDEGLTTTEYRRPPGQQGSRRAATSLQSPAAYGSKSDFAPGYYPSHHVIEIYRAAAPRCQRRAWATSKNSWRRGGLPDANVRLQLQPLGDA